MTVVVETECLCNAASYVYIVATLGVENEDLMSMKYWQNYFAGENRSTRRKMCPTVTQFSIGLNRVSGVRNRRLSSQLRHSNCLLNWGTLMSVPRHSAEIQVLTAACMKISVF
jgi:hypothetical protein